MSAFSDSLIQKEAWSGLMMGNHALVRAMIESGVMVVSAYPGSPTPEIGEALLSVPEEQRPYHFEYSTNEKVAIETAFGASINGHLSACFFKSVGLNVALDSYVQMPLLELTGGMVVILGDDPGANSSQNEQDNRHIARRAYSPMFEPGTPAEAYRMFKAAAALSQKYKILVTLRMTTHVCHAREVIRFDALPQHDYDWTPRYNPPHYLAYWPITSNVFPLKRKTFAKLAAIEKDACSSEFTEEWAPNGKAPIGGRRLGLISFGIPAYSLLENLDESGASIDILKLGITYPLPMERILNFLREHDDVLLLEELDRVFEPEIKSACFDAGITCKLHTRTEVEHLMGEFVPHRTWALLSALWPEAFAPRMAAAPAQEKVAPRVAQMCPGCGHRSAFHAVRELIEQEYPGAITVADIGCHTLGSLEPYNMGTVLLCMGHSNGTAAGMTIGNSVEKVGDKARPVITFIGDSTLFHAGLPAIINAAIYNHNITLVVMENYTTAMTGHQPTHANGEYGDKLNIPDVLEKCGVEFIRSVPAYQQDAIKDALREAIANPGFSVVIAKHPCMLKFLREKARKLARQKVMAPRS
ncbi:indolepyruvate ferredoxin oxidoreductase [bacterium]|nr:indolepyruvate ferredoxin oxidoreductase [bacterium]